MNAEADDICEYAALLGATIPATYKHITSAMTLVQGLPKFLQRCRDGDFTMEHVAVVTRRCRDVSFVNLPVLDDYLFDRRADITVETFARSLALKIAALEPAMDTLEKVSARRRVDISTGDDGTAYLTLTGPAPELHAYYRRIEAFARAVYSGSTGSFGDQLKPGDEFDDDRGIGALMFDIATRTRPQLKLRITSHDTTSGQTTSADFPIYDLVSRPDGAPCPNLERLADYIHRTFGADGADAASVDDGAAAATAEVDGSTVAATVDADGGAVAATVDADSGAAVTTAEADGGAVADVTDEDGTRADVADDEGSAVAVLDEVGPGAAVIDGAPGGEAASRPRPTNPESRAGSVRTADTDVDELPMDGGERDELAEAEGPRTCTYQVLLELPTDEYWLSHQASTVITVPCLTLLDGDPDRDVPPDADVCDLAGMLPDGSPLPVEMARRLAGNSRTWTRILTDPATGTPLDAKATTYAIPESVRRTLKAQWMTCTVPGCTRRAETSEIDHIQPFDHDSPAAGGHTRFGNLHSLCKLHHQAKTDRRFSVRMTSPGRLEYMFADGITAEVCPPDNPINVEQVRMLLSRFDTDRTARCSRGTADADEETALRPPENDTPGADCVQGAPRPGERRRSRACPQPSAEDGSPGWAEYVNPFSDPSQGSIKEWFWDSGEPPPF
ncbi:HNH endonuclease [Brevibacterium sanguinis]|uniref:HNH endonuclease n=2 Tax=Brevibacterium TaxID=1696 RepID=A0A366ICM8_9MICO|nr:MULTISPECIES: HNH endonuclease [Brevibacterium]RBP61899.1 HNH endonuclease [Brevibacterium sanguinis]RBP68655.1 HNH endonuclease [Brevibacterium celere]